jgi:hypothetical protein
MGNTVAQYESKLNSLLVFLSSFADKRGILMDGHKQLHLSIIYKELIKAISVTYINLFSQPIPRNS